ncbi:MAG: hypothetical protein WBA89_28845 [Microcoleus sp.]|uniref:hypothetical protein n=1 Tax=Microcoleus sp. TaxID=44472 RepID=UPI003C76E4E1
MSSPMLLLLYLYKGRSSSALIFSYERAIEFLPNSKHQSPVCIKKRVSNFRLIADMTYFGVSTLFLPIFPQHPTKP